MKYIENRYLAELILKCSAECENCATACLDEKDTDMLRKCIKINLMCAEICRTTAVSIARESDFADKLLKECADVCYECAEECGKHDHDHCRRCADICNNCANYCSRKEVYHHQD